MALTFTRHTVSVSGIPAGAPATWDDVEVLGIHVPAGSRYGTCTLEFPEAFAFASLPAKGEPIWVSLDSTTIFQGHVVAYPGMANPNGERQLLRAADPRWLLTGRRVGDTNYAPAASGFPTVGHRVAFNPGGRRNRSAAKTDDLYTFSEGTDSEYWTRKDVLEFLLGTYGTGVLAVDTALLSARWNEVSLNFMPYSLPLPLAISQLAADCGESWGIGPKSSGAADFVPVVPGGGTTLSVTMAAGDTKLDAAANTVWSAQGEESIERSADVVEVHTGETFIEHTYSTEESAAEAGDALLVAFSPNDKYRFTVGFRADVTKYDSHFLGHALGAGAKPKPWLRELLTRIVPGTIGEPAFVTVAAGSAQEMRGEGRPIKPEECVWIEIAGTRRRVLAGFEIRTGDAEILFEPYVTLETDVAGETEEVTLFEGPEKVWITVVTVTESVDTYRESVTAHVTGQALAEVVVRSDINPAVRYKADVPDFDGGITNLAATLELYRDHETTLAAIAAQRLNGVKDATARVTVKTVDLTTAVALGRKLSFLGNDLAVVDVYYDLQNGVDQLQVTGTSNLSEVMG